MVIYIYPGAHKFSLSISHLSWGPQTLLSHHYPYFPSLTLSISNSLLSFTQPNTLLMWPFFFEFLIRYPGPAPMSRGTQRAQTNPDPHRGLHLRVKCWPRGRLHSQSSNSRPLVKRWSEVTTTPTTLGLCLSFIEILQLHHFSSNRLCSMRVDK